MHLNVSGQVLQSGSDRSFRFRDIIARGGGVGLARNENAALNIRAAGCLIYAAALPSCVLSILAIVSALRSSTEAAMPMPFAIFTTSASSIFCKADLE